MIIRLKTQNFPQEGKYNNARLSAIRLTKNYSVEKNPLGDPGNLYYKKYKREYFVFKVITIAQHVLRCSP